MNTFNSFKNQLVLLILLLCNNSSFSQYLIQYPIQAQSLLVDGQSGDLTVRIDFLSANSINNQVQISLPVGIEYQSNSVLKIGGSPGIQIQEMPSNSNTPQFALIGSNFLAGDFIIFKLGRRANCEARTFALTGGVFKDQVLVTGSSGTILENNPNINSYNVTFPSLNLNAISPPIVNSSVGSSVNRSFTITNGAEGCLDSLVFYIIHPNGQILFQSLSINGINSLPTSINGDTAFFNLSGNGVLTSDGILCYNESITITESVKILSCNSNSHFEVFWGGTQLNACQNINGDFQVSIVSGISSLQNFNISKQASFIDLCGTGSNGNIPLKGTFTWGGASSDGSCTGYNVRLKIGRDGSGAPSYTLYPFLSLINLGNANVNGNIVPSTFVGSIFELNFENLFAVDPDGAGGLSDLDSDGFFDDLAVGSVVNFNFTAQFNPNFFGCYGQEWNRWVSKASYTNNCGQSSSTYNVWSSSLDAFLSSFASGNGYAPANISNNEVVRIRLSTSSAWGYTNNLSIGSLRKYQYIAVLPPGVTVQGTGNPTWNNGLYYTGSTSSPITISTSNDTVYVLSPSNQIGWVEFDVVFNCLTNQQTPLTISYSLYEINNLNTNCKYKVYCSSLSMIPDCSQNCVLGPRNYKPSVQRSIGCLGWTNADMTTKVNISSISAYSLSKALYLDTILVSGSAVQKSNESTFGVRLELTQTSSNQNKLLPIGCKFKLYRNNALIVDSQVANFSLANSSIGVQRVDWDLTGLLPLNGILVGDSVVTTGIYIVNTNDLPNHDVQTAIRWFHYNLVNGNQYLYCNTFVPEMYLVGTTKLVGYNEQTSTGCDISNLNGYMHIARRFDTSGIRFPNEYRPGMYIDSIVINIPNGYEFISAQFQHFGGFNSPYYAINVTPIINGNNYTFVNPGNWKPLDIDVTNVYGARFWLNVRAKCSTLPTEQITDKIYGKDYYYALSNSINYPIAHSGLIWTAIRNINQYGVANLELTNLSGLVDINSNNSSFDFRINNSGTKSAPFFWIALPNNSNYSITSLIDLSNNSVISPINYSGGKWYMISSAGLSAGSIKNYRVNFVPLNCNDDSVKVTTGWNCSSYPIDPSYALCNPDILYVNYHNNNSGIELIPIIEADSVPNLCTNLHYEYLVNSTLLANNYEPKLKITLPLGLNLVNGTSFAEYPVNSGSWQPIVGTLIGNQIEFDLSVFSNISTNGLPGVANSLNSNDKKIKVKFDLITNCDFLGNSGFNLQVTSKNKCGNLSNGSLVTYQSPVLSLDNIYPSYQAMASINNSIIDTISCNDTLDLNVNTLIFGGNTGDHCSQEIVLPLGMTYVNNSFNCNNLICPVVQSVSVNSLGNQVVKLKMPNGIPSGTNINYSISFVDNNLSCGNHLINLYTIDSYDSIICSTAPSGFCNSYSYVLNNVGYAFHMQKTNLDLILSQGVYNWQNDQLTLNLSIQNNSTIAFNDSIFFTAHCVANNTIVNPIPFLTIPQNVLLNAGATMSFNLVIQNPCNYEGIELQMSTGMNCICTNDQVYYSISTALGNQFDFSKLECIEDLGSLFVYELNSSTQATSLLVEKSENGIDWYFVSGKQVSNTRDSILLGFGNNYYKVKLINGNMEILQEDISYVECLNNSVLLYPNPADNKLVIQNVDFKEIKEIEILDLYGRVLYSFDQIDNEHLNVQMLMNGRYVLRVHKNQDILNIPFEILR